MKSIRLGLVAFLLLVATRSAAEEKDVRKIDPNMAGKAAELSTKWTDARSLTIEGQGWKETAHPYDRLPEKAQSVVPELVCTLSQNSAGITVRFITDATKVFGRWTVTNETLGMPHMPATGVSGLDLYVRIDGQWRWAGMGKPESGVTNAVQLAFGIPKEKHEFLLYLPLYNGVKQVDVGVPEDATIEPAQPRPSDHDKPVVIYGTSIVQGGCASRPGMAHAAILGRKLDRPVINLGFSGNGKMEMALENLLAELDAAAYVLDCGPNMSTALVTERYLPFIKALRAARPVTPIVLVESVHVQSSVAFPGLKAGSDEMNREIKRIYHALRGEKVKNLFYVPSEALLGDDGEGTVDGIHPTDLGFVRMADGLYAFLRPILGE